MGLAFPLHVLEPGSFRRYVKEFNRNDDECYAQHVPNAQAWEFLRANIPFFECPDQDIERTYYFRWWTYRKHLRRTPDGFVLTEFLPDVPWAGKYNTISCPAGHHLYEGRWLRDARYLDDYSVFWFRKGGEPRRYSFWAANAIWARGLASGDFRLPIELLDDLAANYAAWEQGFDWDEYRIGQRPNGLFWTIDDRDGGEISVGGHGFRPTLNSFMYGDAVAIAQIARLAGREGLSRSYEAKAQALRHLVQEHLWDPEESFFKVLPEGTGARLADVRELHGYTPWYFGLPEPGRGYEAAWKQIMEPDGFYAPFGPTTTEQRHPGFTISYEGHPCQWNGPSWPFATSMALTAMANVLNEYEQQVISSQDFFELFSIYSHCHRRRQNAVRLAIKDGAAQQLTAERLGVDRTSLREAGDGPCWIDENLNPYTGDWIARTRVELSGVRDTSIRERGKDYNHSTFCDLVITGLMGLRPQADAASIIVNPLAPQEQWDWFCLDGVPYHGRSVTILWDRSGEKYGFGAGLRIFANGHEIANRPNLGRIAATLPCGACVFDGL